MKSLLLTWLLLGSATQFPIDLNHATVEQLCELPGIGRKRAEQIVQQRERKPFRRVQELLLIRGIGAKSFTRLRALVTVVNLEQAQAVRGRGDAGDVALPSTH